jgi:hypothetical protein
VIAPTRILDGFGVFGPPPANAKPVPAGYASRATADHPPGFYGPPEGLVAVNTLAPDDSLAPLDLAGLNARRDVYRMSEPQDLRGPVLLAAMGCWRSMRWWCSCSQAASPSCSAAAHAPPPRPWP